MTETRILDAIHCATYQDLLREYVKGVQGNWHVEEIWVNETLAKELAGQHEREFLEPWPKKFKGVPVEIRL